MSVSKNDIIRVTHMLNQYRSSISWEHKQICYFYTPMDGEEVMVAEGKLLIDEVDGEILITLIDTYDVKDGYPNCEDSYANMMEADFNLGCNKIHEMYKSWLAHKELLEG